MTTTRTRRGLAGLLGLVLTAGGALAVPAAGQQGPAGTAEVAGSVILSEYVEGSSSNKALEVANLTGEDVDLAGYQVEMFFNGNSDPGLTVPLSGTLAAGEVHVLAHSAAAPPIVERADQTNGAGWFNGDDAVVLRGPDGVLDVVGQVGEDPGTAWGSAPTRTVDTTLRRAASVCEGDTDPRDAFDPADAGWTGHGQDVFDGLGEHAADCGGTGPGDPGGAAAAVINEFSASTAGADVEYLELLGPAGADLSALTVLQVEGDSTSSRQGQVVSSHLAGNADAGGYWLAELDTGALQNGTLSLLLVEGYEDQRVLDADRDGQLDEGLGLTVVDAVAVDDGGSGDLTYGGTTLGGGYDGVSDYVPGGASRLPDGGDTDTVEDWVRNDFDLAGIEGHEGTLAAGEARNTPGARNEAYEGEAPDGGSCEEAATLVGEVQGAGAQSPLVGQPVTVEGTVVGDFQTGGFAGYYLQDAGDDDPATSDGVFVHHPGGPAVTEGDTVRVTGTVAEYYGMTQVSAAEAVVCATGGELPEAAPLQLPLSAQGKERHEGMRVTLPQDLAILEFYSFGRYGEIVLGTDRQFQPTAVYEPGSPEAQDLLAANLASRITLDDGRSAQNPDPAIHPNGEEFTLENSFRGGDLVTDATGVLDYRFDRWRLQPTEGAQLTTANPRPAAPEVAGELQVASFNVLNYFTTLGSRGADTEEELQRQEAKIVAALAELDADVVGLIEIENNGDVALATLTEALNDHLGQERYDYVATGTIGSDEITTALIYRPDRVSPVGDFATLTSQDDERFLDTKSRPTLAQTFRDEAAGGMVTVAVNHLKSKGSSCADVGDPEDPDGQGNCNRVRTDAAEAMADWLADDPTGTGVEETLVIGDLNAYDKEDPVEALREAGYTDLLLEHQGEHAYSYVFDGQLGYLDHALANEALLDQVAGAEVWAVNADEPSLLDYDTTFKEPAQQAIYAPGPYRSSDHDPVVVGLDLAPRDTTAPEVRVAADPAALWPPNGKQVPVRVTVAARDDTTAEEDLQIEFVEAVADGDGSIEEVDGRPYEFRVTATREARYTLTYAVSDEAGNTTLVDVTVAVAGPQPGPQQPESISS